MSRERIAGVVALVGAVILLPVAAWAQGSAIAGVVRDSTGGVLPGVTVEAASPVLIEKVRTAVTDDQGNFKIANLPPGKYTLTAWHEKFGQQTKDIEVAAKDSKAVDFEFKQ